MAKILLCDDQQMIHKTLCEAIWVESTETATRFIYTLSLLDKETHESTRDRENRSQKLPKNKKALIPVE